jgi:hypothetical protein
MTNSIFKKTFIFSLLGHITVLSIFNLSFGSRIPKIDYTGVSFWGQFLNKSELIQPQPKISTPTSKSLVRGLMRKPDTSVLDKATRGSISPNSFYVPAEAGSHPMPNNNWREKPPLTLTFSPGKGVFIKSTSAFLPLRKKEPEIIFHPLLPYSFTLYFNDRQIAHVELLFSIISNDKPLRNSAVIKRKISSGNLEADLLIMRYIEHYLFIQQARFTPNSWQSVKIDLSGKSD